MRVLVFLLLAACVEPVDQRWELDHDHVVAVRANPPRLMPGESARIDGLVAHDGESPRVEMPSAAAGTEDPLLANLVGQGTWRNPGWFVTAPSEDTLAAVRARDGLAVDAPVPFDVVMAFEGPLYAKKTIWFGARSENPSAPAMVIDGQPAADRIDVPTGEDVYVSVTVEPGARVNWLTSCGTLFQDDVATAFLRVTDDDRAAGDLAVVIRDPRGGVAWQVWPMTAR
jgi:hypothetical protein